MLGLHAGITYANSRTAIATSIGTLLFLFLGIATCMRIMLAFTDSFEYQFGAFLGVIAGGSLAMYVALGWRNPSPALGWASGLTPFLTFFIITSFLLGQFRHRVSVDRVHLRLRDRGDAGAGDLRVRRRDRAHDRARRMTIAKCGTVSDADSRRSCD